MTNEKEQYSEGTKTDKNWEEWNPEIEHKITIEEYRPVGTLTLTLIYFVIIALMWIFMYFVEFAGNDPSIIG